MSRETMVQLTTVKQSTISRLLQIRLVSSVFLVFGQLFLHAMCNTIDSQYSAVQYSTVLCTILQ